MNAKELINKAATYVRDMFVEHEKPELLYHNLQHTENVVKSGIQIADHYQLSEEDHTAVVVACWFHDLGYLVSDADAHEVRGAEMSAKFLKENGCADTLINKTKECIEATKMPQSPKSLISEIVCDADLFHLGTDQFMEINKLVRKEHMLRCQQKISGSDWRKYSLKFLEAHKFHTDYCKALLQKGQQENVQLLKDRIKKDKKEKKKEVMAAAEKKVKETRPSRGVETMFRTTSTNHLRLSELADSKANIMITVNSIIASILVSVLFRKLEDDHRLILPAILFLATSLISIIFAILVTRPNVTQGTFTKEDVKKKRANLLFFGNFHQMQLKDYQEGVNAMMNDADFLYGSMTRDIYNLGVVLGRKYKLLRITYSVFMFGFVISILSFVLAVTLFNK